MEEVKVHGAWASPFSCRVIWALKLKGVPYEFIEEDLSNKSALLLNYNPVHKQIPVLVHAGKPICESLVILEYIEETWPQSPLLPSDPFDKAVARFWSKFADDKGSTMWTMFRTTGKEHDKAVKDTVDMLKTIEEMLAAGENKFFCGERVGMVDITLGSIGHWVEVLEEVVGVKLLKGNAHLFPHWHQWMMNFRAIPLIKRSLPDHEEMVVFFKRLWQILLNLSL